jgi:pimeloyl-ACP methyl ester carboxylesterase
MDTIVSPAATRPVTASTAATSASPAYRQLRFRVGADEQWEVAGHLYLPASGAQRTVQVLVPGLTYDHRYWTAPCRYDYTQHMVSAGYAVLALDRIGTGASSRPPARDVTTDAHALVLHQVIWALRAGYGCEHPFDRVIVAGHSYGSGVAIVAAARHADIDGLIVSGMLHTTSQLHADARSFFHHAADDPVLGRTEVAWPDLYMTQRPGLRARMLENPADIDDPISRYNESIKSTATIGEGDSLAQTYDARYSRAIEVPVLVVVGERDALFSSEAVSFAAETAAVREFEKDFYAPGAKLEVHVIPQAGHSLNLHRSAPRWFAIAREWSDRHIGA